MVSSFYSLPGWFFGYDIALELIFGVITALVAFFSWKIYGLCKERHCRLLGFAFVSISISYFLLAFLNLLAASSQVGGTLITISLKNVIVPSSIWIYAYIFFFLFGLSMLTYLTFKVRDQRLFVLIVSLSMVVVIFSKQAGVAFNFVAAVLLFYVLLFYVDSYKKSKRGKGVLVMLAFLLLFFARISFVFAYLNPLPYVADHIIELIAYGLLLLSLVSTARK